MKDSCLPKQLFCSEITQAQEGKEEQTKEDKDGLKQALHTCNISTTDWESLAANRSAWHQAFSKGIRYFKKKLLEHLDAKRQARK